MLNELARPTWEESIQEKETQSTQFSVQSVKAIFILFKCHRFNHSNDFYIFYLVMKILMIKKNSVVKIQNLVVNHQSQPVKSNPVKVTNSWHWTSL